jgi:spoIIIJ-associated protein
MLSDTIQTLASQLLEKIGIEAKVTVEEEKNETGEKVFLVDIDSPTQAGLLIGAHGSTLSAIQSFLALGVKQKTGEWVRVVVDIGDWRQKHEEHLSSLAMSAAERAKATGEPQHLYNLTPAQRRVVHMVLSEQKGVVTESEGEGAARYLIVKAE